MNIPSSSRRGNRQNGVATIHLIVMLAVFALVDAGLMSRNVRLLSEIQGKMIGGMEATIRDAVDAYLKTWVPNITGGKDIPIAGGGKVADVLAPTLTELQALGHLSAPVSNPPHGGLWRLVIEPTPATCTIPGPCNLASSIWATSPLTKLADPSRVDQVAINAALAAIGSDGGFSEDSTPSTVIGAGGWTRPNKNGAVAGTLMSIGGYGSSTYVALVNVGDACTTVGSVATSTVGQQLICRGSPSKYVPTVNALPSYAARGAKVLVKDGDVVAKPTCDVGGTSAYSFEVNQSAIDLTVVPPLQAQYAATDDQGTSWKVKIKLKDRNTTEVSGNTYNITAIMHIECYYP